MLLTWLWILISHFYQCSLLVLPFEKNISQGLLAWSLRLQLSDMLLIAAAWCDIFWAFGLINCRCDIPCCLRGELCRVAPSITLISICSKIKAKFCQSPVILECRCLMKTLCLASSEAVKPKIWLLFVHVLEILSLLFLFQTVLHTMLNVVSVKALLLCSVGS